jgi:hypothetical protein
VLNCYYAVIFLFEALQVCDNQKKLQLCIQNGDIWHTFSYTVYVLEAAHGKSCDTNAGKAMTINRSTIGAISKMTEKMYKL